MSDLISPTAAWLNAHGYLALPLLLAGLIAWGDLMTGRIPNYLTLGGALAGLGFQLGSQGLPGLAAGLAGMALGFLFLFIPYWWGGMGAGDVKALAALGAWMGPTGIFYLFFYMGISGGLLALGDLWRRGLLWRKIRHGWVALVNLGLGGPPAPRRAASDVGAGNIPYGLALALGMVFLCWRG